MWLVLTVLSLTVGVVVGVAFVWCWSLFRVFFLGYGDSGPSWVNVVSDVVFIGGLVLCVVAVQWIYFRKVRRRVNAAVKPHAQ